jgi:hypothetical protein
MGRSKQFSVATTPVRLLFSYYVCRKTRDFSPDASSFARENGYFLCLQIFTRDLFPDRTSFFGLRNIKVKDSVGPYHRILQFISLICAVLQASNSLVTHYF